MPMDEVIWPPDGPDGEQAAAVVTEPAHIGPPPSSTDSGGRVQEPHRGGDEDENAGQPEQDAPEEFDQRVREPFEGLLFLGRLTKTFSWLGHTFEIKTLNTDEVLDVAIVTKSWEGTLGHTKAYQAAVVGACVLSVDGRPLPIPITNDPLDTGVRTRFDYVRRSWFPPVLDYVYEQFLLLESDVQRALEAMGKASR